MREYDPHCRRRYTLDSLQLSDRARMHRGNTLSNFMRQARKPVKRDILRNQPGLFLPDDVNFQSLTIQIHRIARFGLKIGAGPVAELLELRPNSVNSLKIDVGIAE